MIHRFSSSLTLLRLIFLAVFVITLGGLWGLFAQQKANSERQALEAKGAEHLNLATLAAENLRQLVDRTQIIGKVAQSGMLGLDQHHWSVVRMLAEDPVVKRMSLYDSAGLLVSSTHPDEPARLFSRWLSQLQAHVEAYGLTPVLSPLAPAERYRTATWRLPFMLPMADPASGQVDGVLVVQMDVGYLAALFEHIDLGDTGMMRLLDGEGHERLRLSNRGIVVSGPALGPGLQPEDGEYGELVQRSRTAVYQSMFRQVPQRGFSVVISQDRAEILAASHAATADQLLIDLTLTLFIILGLVGSYRVLSRRHVAFEALEKAQEVNQELIQRLEREHSDSSHAAATDHLSGLRNRRRFLEVAEEVLVRQRNKRRLMAILFIDMDRFKSINDSLGHKVGDLLLQAVAGRIRRSLEATDEAARFGGDEFVILLGGERSEEMIEAWVKALVDKLSAVYSLDGCEVTTSPSVGVSICPRDGQNIEEMIRCADAAMYSAKGAGRGQYRFFDPSLNAIDVNEFLLEQALPNGVNERQFVLHFQPQIRLDSMLVESYEALVRWQHPEAGLLFPDRFIHLAERSGFINALGWEVLRLACIELVRWREEDKPAARMAINVSTIQLRQEDFATRVLDELARFDLPPDLLELEITETIMLGDEVQAIEHLTRLRAAGLQISLDDFGKGYAGFAHLQALPITKLKIDRSVIAPLSNSPDDSPIVSSTIILAKRLGLTVVAEGVETLDQVICLRLAGCDVAQGYHFARPLSAAQLETYPPFMNAQEKACLQ